MESMVSIWTAGPSPYFNASFLSSAHHIAHHLILV